MQLLFAAPFIAAALLIFLICVAIPSARRHAIPCSGAVVSSGPGAALGFLMTILVTDHVLHAKNTGDGWFLTAAAIGGVLASLVAALSIRIILRLTSATLLQWIVFAACFGHLLAASVIVLSASLNRVYSRMDGRILATLFLTFPVFISVYPSIFLARNAEQFRPRTLRRHLTTAHDDILGRLP